MMIYFMRTKKALINAIVSIVLQLITIVIGFILPKIFLEAFGSEINGAISSITQFLGSITLLEVGVGGVTRAALYKPLAENDTYKISGIVNATKQFFRKLAFIFVLYALFLALTFKYISSTELGFTFVFTLVVIISVSQLSQYYFGSSYYILLQADQNRYISSSMDIVIIIINTIITILLIKMGFNILVIKFISVFIYSLKPVLLSLYVSKKYRIDKAVPLDNEAIKQKWNGLGHHLAYYVQNNVDMMVVTVQLGLKWASVYSVYHMILWGVDGFLNSALSFKEAIYGNMIAKGEINLLKKRFVLMETISSILNVVFYSTCGLLILDFIRIYTENIHDINYVITSVAILFIATAYCTSVKDNFNDIVLAAGHYKQTQMSAFIEAGLNLFLSVILAHYLGLEGILIATIVSVSYRIIYYVLYLSKHIINRQPQAFIKRQMVNALNIMFIVLSFGLFKFGVIDNYLLWVGKAIIVFGYTIIITLMFNLLFYKNDVKEGFNLLFSTFKRK